MYVIVGSKVDYCTLRYYDRSCELTANFHKVSYILSEFGGDDGDIEFNAAQEFHYDGDTSLYEDEETQQFYEKLSDLKAIVPQILLKDSQISQETADKDKQEENKEGGFSIMCWSCCLIWATHSQCSSVDRQMP